MAGDINQVILVGRLTRDAELRYTAGGTAICNFAIAVNRRVKKGDQWIDEASFFDLQLWDKQAENLQRYLNKGQQVAIAGELQQERWEKDGKHLSKIKVNTGCIQLLGGKPTGADKPERHDDHPAAAHEDFDPQAYEDDIPF